MPLAATLLSLCIAAAGPARIAAAQESTPELRKLCADDYKKYCASVAPGGGAIRDCMQLNIDKLSAQCRAGLEEWKKAKGKS